ncbi:hypothetical protein ACPPVO_27920 [Dactylosporangium sp. McL0621]|uniref:hypothetical protein n=1 Tax=Dactylosporangium sp. McL0621 TaxID=3415678 RepID=UPI003CE92FAE
MQPPANGWTVGPLPPSVYWRRRAMVAVVVVGALLIVWIFLRGGDGDGKPSAVASGAASGAAGTPGSVAATTPGAESSAPQIVPANPESSSPPPVERSAPPANVAPCGDDQIAVIVTATPSPGVVGGTFTFNINVASKAAGWCSRDLGPGAQEVQVLHDGALLFSSDDCDAKKTSDVRAFAAGDAVRYRFVWSSYRTTPHACAPAQNPAPAGTYQVVARVGTKVSGPTDFTINR